MIDMTIYKPNKNLIRTFVVPRMSLELCTCICVCDVSHKNFDFFFVCIRLEFDFLDVLFKVPMTVFVFC